jgi:broad specificity phosphatase PhoE
MRTSIFLVRHGQTNSNTTGFLMGWSDENLNEVGYAQARALSSRLANLPISSIYTSPLRRTFNTATILAKPHKLEPIVTDEFIEIHPGDWQGLYIDEIKQKWPELWQQSRTDVSNVTLPNGESFRQVTERAVRAFHTLIEANHGKNIAIVSHEVVIKVIVVHILEATNSIYRRFEIQNASLSIIQITDGIASLATLNDVSHLESAI